MGCHCAFEGCCQLRFSGTLWFNCNSDEKELSSKTIEESKKAVSLLVLTIKQFENSFAFNTDSKKELHNIGTGSIVTKEMREDISNVIVWGKESTIKCLNERLKDERCFILGHLIQATNEDIFHSRKSLERNPKKETLNSFEAQHNLFLWLSTLSKTKTVDLRSVISYRLLGVPLSIFHSTGE